jgi:hypothetical protein
MVEELQHPYSISLLSVFNPTSELVIALLFENSYSALRPAISFPQLVRAGVVGYTL